MNAISKFLKETGVTQTELSSRTNVHKSAMSRAVNEKRGVSVPVSFKVEAETGIPASIVYGGTQYAAIMRAVEEGEMDETTAAEKMLGLVRKLLDRFEDVEEEEGGEELVAAIIEALEDFTGKTVDSVKGTKTATKNAGVPSAFKSQFDLAGTVAPDPRDYDTDLDEGERDVWGRRLNSRKLRDPREADFPDVDDFGSANVPNSYEDDYESDGRDALGRRVRPFDGRR